MTSFIHVHVLVFLYVLYNVRITVMLVSHTTKITKKQIFMHSNSFNGNREVFVSWYNPILIELAE